MDWAKDLPFDVPVVGQGVDDLSAVDYLFWVGCAGAFDDRAKKTTRAVAELLHVAGVAYAVLGNGETAPATRPVERATSSSSATGPGERRDPEGGQGDQDRHGLRALPEHPQERVPAARRLDEVVHHTQLLNRLVRDGWLTRSRLRRGPWPTGP